MKCFRSPLFYWAFLLVSFFISGFLINNVSAVEPLSVSFSTNQSLGDGVVLFPDCDQSCYENYNYIYVHVDNPDYSNMSTVRMYMTSRSATNYRWEFNFSGYVDAYYDISSFFYLRYSGAWGKSPTDITFILMDSLPAGDCPVCEECQVCPAIPENPYDDKFDKIITAIYVCAATILVVYFFYCIYRIIIKSAGSV